MIIEIFINVFVGFLSSKFAVSVTETASEVYTFKNRNEQTMSSKLWYLILNSQVFDPVACGLLCP